MPGRSRGPRVTVTIKEADESVVERCLQETMASLHPEGGGTLIQNRFTLDAAIEIITQKVNIGGLDDRDEIRGIIHDALLRLRRYRQHSLSMFRRAVATETRRRAKPSAPFTVLMLLNVQSQSVAPFAPFDILGLQLQSPGWQHVQGPELDRALQRAEGIIFNTQPVWWSGLFEPIVCEVEATDIRNAVREAERSFDTLRPLLNLVGLWRTAWRQFGPPRPLGKVRPSPMFAVFDEAGHFREPLFYSVVIQDLHHYQLEIVHRRKIEKAVELARRLGAGGQDRDLRDLLTDIIRKYGHAMDTADWQQAFLTLWQALEMVASPLGSYIKMDMVMSRVSRLFNKDSLLEDIVRWAGQTRNELVHSGRFSSEYGLHQVNLLKAVVENVINVLFARLDDLPSVHSLESYHVQCPRKNIDLEETHRVITLIAREKGLDLTDQSE